LGWMMIRKTLTKIHCVMQQSKLVHVRKNALLQGHDARRKRKPKVGSRPEGNQEEL